MKSLCVEGWRFSPHSYALVNQWQLLSLLKRKDILLSVRDRPFYRNHWNVTKGLFNLEDETKLASIPILSANEFSDVTYRIAFPLDFSVLARGHTVVFGTSENQVVNKSMLPEPIDVATLSNSDSFFVVTPSRWSREGFVKLGLRDDQIIVVPHGFARNTFYPSELTRKNARERYKLSGFVFANASAMTGNKGIDILLQAFAVVAEKYPDVRLLLKGADELYRSKPFLAQAFSNLALSRQALIREKILYFGGTISVNGMAEFYHTADAYVSPYRAEGFNLPVLEAIACGTPVICTKGGPTDDFLDEEFAFLIDSKLKPTTFGPISGVRLEPSLDHLIQLMLRVIEDETCRHKASIKGVDRVTTKYNWDTVVEKLVVSIFM
jgi:glycosyltransferase involved in cell wall biosynthesis